MLTASTAFLAAFTASAAEPAYVRPKSEWKPLFNGRDLAGWDTYVATESGDAPLVPNVDRNQTFSVTNLNGEGVVFVSGQTYGAITTREEFENFHFKIEFKWGPGRFGGRANVGRDSGILYCGIGAPNPRTGWLTSVENNIMEKGVGQWWSVNGAVIDCEGEWVTPANELYVPYKKEGAGEKNVVWRKGGPRIQVPNSSGITPPFDVEQVFGNWNTVEVVFWAGQCIHILDGHVNLVAFNPRYRNGNDWLPLTRGRIQLQSEGAEVFYRNARIRPLYELPPELLDQVVSPVGADDEFLPLLSPSALKDWKQSGSGKFTVTDGVASAEGGMGLWWYAGRTFRNFVLRGDFLQTHEIADSGVFFRFPDPGQDPWIAVRQGHEMEIGDPKPENPTWRTGSIYPFQPSLAANTLPPGHWNRFEVVCRGPNFSVQINDKVVTTWTDTTGRSLEGFIGLQNYDDGKTVRFRNLRIKDIL